MLGKADSSRVVEIYSNEKIINIYSRIGIWPAEKLVFDRYLTGSGPLTILDLGCGAGRVAIPLAGLGHRIVGLDLTRQILREAARLSKRNGRSMEVLAADARAIPLRGDSIDCVICMHSSFGVFLSLSERKAVIHETWRVLREGGMFILNVHNIFYPGPWGKRWAKWIMLLAQKLLRGDNEWHNRLVDEYGHSLQCHYYTLRELTRLLEDCYDILDVFGCNGFWDKNRPNKYLPDILAEDWIIVGRKRCR